VGIDEVTAAQSGVSLAHLVAALKQTVADLVPDAQTHATVALAPRGAGGRDVDVVRLALHDPAADRNRAQPEPAAEVVVDLTRQHVRIHGRQVGLTEKEFRLFAQLIQHEGETVPRASLVSELWRDCTERPSLRTIDVHVRRLRAKLGEFQDIIHTVRGIGYRFDRHADVLVQAA
jgi:DNA-binding response OmpR family regulator